MLELLKNKYVVIWWALLLIVVVVMVFSSLWTSQKWAVIGGNGSFTNQGTIDASVKNTTDIDTNVNTGDALRNTEDILSELRWE